MSKIMKFYEFINEGLSEVLFHYTRPAAAASILTGNSFALLPVVTDEIDAKLNKGKMYFMSFTRSGTKSAYNGTKIGAIVGGNCAVRLVVDGKALQSKTKGAPVDYLKDANFRDKDADEMEDRIFSDKRLIGGARKMIKEIQVLMVTKDYKGKNVDANKINDLKELCGEYHITFKFFDSRDDFDNAVPKKLPGKNVPGRQKEEYVAREHDDVDAELEDFSEFLAWLSIADKDTDKMLTTPGLDKDLRFTGKKLESMKRDIEKKKQDILKDDPYDAAHALQTLFVNHRKYTGGYINNAIEELSKTMKKMGVNNITAFVDSLMKTKVAA